MKLIVIGKSGQLAWELQRLSTNNIEVVCLGRDDIDISDLNALTEILKSYNATVVINAAAYTAVDRAEVESESAHKINALAVGVLASACKTLSMHLVHISTDFVFQGDKGSPYLPNDPVSPINVYGLSKAEGEKAILECYPEASTIIRTSWVYSTHGNNFVKTMISLMKSKLELNIISDQIGSPTYAKGLAKACLLAAETNLAGTYHFTDAGVASWYDFAVAIQDIALDLGLLDKRIPIKPIRTEDYSTPAKRPDYSVLDKTSFNQALPSLPITHWRDALKQMLDELKSES